MGSKRYFKPLLRVDTSRVPHYSPAFVAAAIHLGRAERECKETPHGHQDQKEDFK